MNSNLRETIQRDRGFAEAAHNLLAETDAFAVKNVAAGGGPFGAQIVVYDLKSGEYIRAGEIKANAVVLTGEPGAHAENQALQSSNVEALIDILTSWKAEGREPVVIFPSSGQSCQSCHSKEEIIARYLVAMDLIKPGAFVVVYGATFEDTARVAGFNDLPYVLDMLRFYQDPRSGISMVRHGVAELNDIPSAVSAIFRHAEKQVTVLSKGKEILSVGEDLRSVSDRISTAEIVALRRAGARQLEAKIKEAWILGDKNYLHPNPETIATLYTTSTTIGSAARGDFQWGAVGLMVTVVQSGKALPETQEAAGLDNSEFRKTVAHGYNHPGSYMTVFRDPDFGNAAQRAWQAKNDSVMYNGFGDDPDLERFVPVYRQRFNGISLAR